MSLVGATLSHLEQQLVGKVVSGGVSEGPPICSHSRTYVPPSQACVP